MFILRKLERVLIWKKVINIINTLTECGNRLGQQKL